MDDGGQKESDYVGNRKEYLISFRDLWNQFVQEENLYGLIGLLKLDPFTAKLDDGVVQFAETINTILAGQNTILHLAVKKLI